MTTDTTPEDCTHHWEIDRPDGGPTSKGTCKNCGATKDFRNTIGDAKKQGGQ